MKKYELESEGFFNRCLYLCGKHVRILSAAMGCTICVGLNTWHWFLTLLGLFGFFGFLLGLPAIYLGFQVSPVLAYAWLFMWLAVACLVWYREEMRHEKAMTASEYVSNLNAIQEYLELVKKEDGL